MTRTPTIRYRCPLAHGNPSPGHILMGEGPRVRHAYRVLTINRVRSATIGLGMATWKLTVEPMSAARGREEIEAGTPAWGIQWDSRKKRA